MSHEEMIPVIIDLQVLESHYQRLYQRPNLFKDALDSASTFVFDKHNVKRERFERSYAYYSLHLEEMFIIYESALDSVNLRLDQDINTEDVQ